MSGPALMRRIGYGCQFLTNSGQWRIPLAIQIVPAIMLFLYVVLFLFVGQG
jgi:hypothetical protein